MENKLEYFEDGINVNGEFISLQDITEKCNNIKIEKEDSVLLKIEWHGRGGYSYEYKIYPKQTAKKLKKLLIGKFAYLGEVWGKHSEVCGDLEDKDITIVSDKKEVKEFLSEYPNGSDASDYFIDSILEYYEDNGGREEYEENEGKKYCDEIDGIKKLY